MKDSAISVIIPVKDEGASLAPLHNQLTDALSKQKLEYELLFINDGSRDNSADILQSLQKRDKRIKIVTFRSNYGKSAALTAGFYFAVNPIIVTIDADLQDDPADIPLLLAPLNEGYDVAIGWRKHRKDSFLKRVSSLLFNQGTTFITGIHFHDLNCGLKALKKSVSAQLVLHGDLHRFLPILAVKKKFRVIEVPVHNRPRQFGTSKFGMERGWRSIIDLLTTVFITDYARKPAHFFGKFGLLFFSIGFLMDGYVTIIKLITGDTQGRIPLLLAGILCMVLGVQLLSTGLIAEIIIRNEKKEEFLNFISETHL